jgi:hypothetical protein
MSDGELALAELWDFEEVVFAIGCFSFLLIFVVVCRGAVGVRSAHID